MNAIKKLFKLLTSFLLVILLFLNLPLVANGEESLTIPRWLVESEIMENGDLRIVEDITFKFNDVFNGVFREVILNDTDGVEGVQVSELIEGREIDYSLDNNAEKGDSNVYLIDEDNESINLQIFSPSEDEQKTFRISYTVKNVSVKYNDTGELYYQFLGDENNTPIDFFGVNIKLPGKATDRVKIFAHGPSNGNIDFIGDNIIRAEVENVANFTFVEVRALFPVEFIADSTNVIDENGYDEIIEEEVAYIQELENKGIRKEERRTLLGYASIIISGLMAAFLAITFSKHRRQVSIHDINSLDPDYNSPAIVARVVNSTISTETLMATLFDLARRGYLSIEDDGNQKKNIDNFKMNKLDKSYDSLLKHERHLLNWLFNYIGNQETVNTKDIEHYSKYNSTSFYNGYSEWTELVSEGSKEKGYYDNTSKTAGVLLLIVSIVAFVISIATLIHESFYGILLLIISIIVFIYSMVLLVRKSDYGYLQTKKWQSFKKDLKQRSKNLNIDDLTYSLDKALIYGLALGISFKSLKNFQSYIPQSTMPNYWMYWFFFTNSHGDNTFEKSMNSSFESTGSSVGSGGGFSAGGGGGAGGGGAGGF